MMLFWVNNAQIVDLCVFLFVCNLVTKLFPISLHQKMRELELILMMMILVVEVKTIFVLEMEMLPLQLNQWV